MKGANNLYRTSLVVLAYVVLVTAFFWQLIFLPNTYVPVGGGDLVSMLYPVYTFAARSLQQGVIPFWNPYLYSGSPFAADMQSGVFYPLNLGAFLLVRPFTYAALEGLVVIHYFLAAIFTYLYLRCLGLDRVASLGGGVVFAFSGFMVAHLGHGNMVAAAVWLPLILLFFHRTLVGGEVLMAMAAGGAFALSILAGHIQVSLYLALFLLLYWVWGLTHEPRRAASYLSLPVTGITALGASAVLWLPALELVTLSLRSEISYAKAVEYAVSPWSLVQLAVPHFFGGDPLSFWGLEGNFVEGYGYVGLSTLVLGGLGLVSRGRLGGWKWFFLGAAFLFLLLSLGQSTVLHGWLYRFVPGFDKVRAPGRFLMLFGFSLSVLAAQGLQTLGRPVSWRERPPHGILLIAVAVLLGGGLLVLAPLFYHAALTSQDKAAVILQRVMAALNSLNLSLLFLGVSFFLLLAHRFRRSWARFLPLLGVGLIVLDLFAANWGINPTQEDITVGYQHPQVVRFLRESGFRVDSVTNVWDVWQPNSGLVHELDDVMGIFNPMMLRDYQAYWENLPSRSVPAYDLLNARYVIAHKDVTLDWNKFTPVVTDAPKVNVYENQRALPRAMVVPRGEVLGREDILRRLREPNFDPRQVVLLESGAPASGTPGEEGKGRVLSLTRPTVNEVSIDVETAAPGYLLLSEVAYPGWRGYVDGREVPVLRADYIFKAVPLPAGSHQVRFVFLPRWWTIAWIATLLSWVAVAVLLARSLIYAWRARLGMV
ncbi:MAG: YfhO family protein [Chloroflexi bacterium]|nr:YfhO family protein [Chloroflexota bacterium]